jgi:cell wall assembly regulator SMI1
MPHDHALAAVWERFIDLLAAQAPERLGYIRPPATREALTEAEQRLQCTLPEELRELYALAGGFVAGAYMLCDDYRLLPLDEMVEASLALVGEPVVLDALAGEISQAKRVIRLVVAQAKADDPNIVQVSMRLWPKKRPSMETWYRAGGIHDFEEVVDTHESLTAWLEGCLEYYL